jgi:hypothetical protein
MNEIQQSPYMDKIPIPQFEMIPLSKLLWPQPNRGKESTHVDIIKESVLDNGLMGAIKVFKEDCDGKHKVADANHTTDSLKDIFKQNPNIKVPCLVLWWKDEEDIEDVQQTIITLNHINKVWSLYDYIKSHAEISSRKNHKIMCEIRDNMRKYTKFKMTNGVVASIYTGDSRNHGSLKNGTYELKDCDRFYVDKFLNKLSWFIDQEGKKHFKATFLRRLVNKLWQSARTLNDTNLWEKLFNKVLDDVSTIISLPNQPLPDGDEVFDEFYSNVKKKVGLSS